MFKKFLKSKKAQPALEFIIVFIFIFVLIGVIIAITGRISVDLRNDEIRKNLDDFANSILLEFELMQKVEGGYEKEIYIEPHLMEQFNLTFNQNFLIISELESYENDYPPIYYEIPGDVNYNLSEWNSSTPLIITLKKEYKDSYEGILVHKIPN